MSWLYKNASLLQLSLYGAVGAGLLFLGHFS